MNKKLIVFYAGIFGFCGYGNAMVIAEGQYLPAGSNSSMICPSGYYCPGVADAQYDANNDQGKIACSTVGNGSYTSSEQGATSGDGCYKACSVSDVSNSLTVSGRVYSNGTNTCAAESCASGYRVKPGNPLLSVLNVAGNILGVPHDNMFYVNYNNLGVVRGRAACSTVLGTNDIENGIEPTNFASLVDETGESDAVNCYCKLDGFLPESQFGCLAHSQLSVRGIELGTCVFENISSSWFYWTEYSNYTPMSSEPTKTKEEYCTQYCPQVCQNVMRADYNPYAMNWFDFKGVMFNSAGNSQYASCERASVTVAAGQYLPANSMTLTTCPAGYYCPGGIEAQYGANNDQGKIACSTVDNGSYINSEQGATSGNDCYKACSVSDVSNSLTVSGRVYSNGTNTCAAESCVSGYRVKPGNPLLAVGDMQGNLIGFEDGGEFWVDYPGFGLGHGHAVCSTVVGDDDNYTWENPTLLSNLTDETGEPGATNCYCKLDSYLPEAQLDCLANGQFSVLGIENGTCVFENVSLSWGYWTEYHTYVPHFSSDAGKSSEELCAKYCPDVCTSGLIGTSSVSNMYNSQLNFRHAVFNSGGISSYATCERASVTVAAGQYLAAGDTLGTICPENHWCPGGSFALSNQDVGIYACSDGMTAPLGTTNEGDCGRVLHVGQDTLYLTQERRTLPALAVRLDNKVYYGKTAPVSGGVKPMNTDTTNQLRLRLDGVEYSIY